MGIRSFIEGTAEFFGMLFAKQVSNDVIETRVLNYLLGHPGTPAYKLFNLFPDVSEYKKGPVLSLAKLYSQLQRMEREGLVHRKKTSPDGYNIYSWYLGAKPTINEPVGE